MLTAQELHKGNKSPGVTVTYDDTNSPVHTMPVVDITSSSNPHIKPVRQVGEGILSFPCPWVSLPKHQKSLRLCQHPKYPCHQHELSSGHLWLIPEPSTKMQMDLPSNSIHQRETWWKRLTVGSILSSCLI